MSNENNTTVTTTEKGILIDTDASVLAQALVLLCQDAGLLPRCFDLMPDMKVLSAQLGSDRVRLFIGHDPLYEAAWQSTHRSIADGSEARLLTMTENGHNAVFDNENGDSWQDNPRDWGPLP
jgi:hypothetical protein